MFLANKFLRDKLVSEKGTLPKNIKNVLNLVTRSLDEFLRIRLQEMSGKFYVGFIYVFE